MIASLTDDEIKKEEICDDDETIVRRNWLQLGLYSYKIKCNDLFLWWLPD